MLHLQSDPPLCTDLSSYSASPLTPLRPGNYDAERNLFARASSGRQAARAEHARRGLHARRHPGRNAGDDAAIFTVGSFEPRRRRPFGVWRAAVRTFWGDERYDGNADRDILSFPLSVVAGTPFPYRYEIDGSVSALGGRRRRDLLLRRPSARRRDHSLQGLTQAGTRGHEGGNLGKPSRDLPLIRKALGQGDQTPGTSPSRRPAEASGGRNPAVPLSR
jgi:hypothetical protein